MCRIHFQHLLPPNSSQNHFSFQCLSYSQYFHWCCLCDCFDLSNRCSTDGSAASLCINFLSIYSSSSVTFIVFKSFKINLFYSLIIGFYSVHSVLIYCLHKEVIQSTNCTAFTSTIINLETPLLLINIMYIGSSSVN